MIAAAILAAALTLPEPPQCFGGSVVSYLFLAQPGTAATYRTGRYVDRLVIDASGEVEMIRDGRTSFLEWEGRTIELPTRTTDPFGRVVIALPTGINPWLPLPQASPDRPVVKP